MSDTYFIRGTISVQVGGGTSMLLVTPCAGFLTPDKKKAIAFPIPSETSNPPEAFTKAVLIGLKEGKTFPCKYGAEGITLCLPALISLAAQSKPIELSLNVSKPEEIKVAGFTYPAPSDHAPVC